MVLVYNTLASGVFRIIGCPQEACEENSAALRLVGWIAALLNLDGALNDELWRLRFGGRFMLTENRSLT